MKTKLCLLIGEIIDFIQKNEDYEMTIDYSHFNAFNMDIGSHHHEEITISGAKKILKYMKSGV
jgi:hypothetical protein